MRTPPDPPLVAPGPGRLRQAWPAIRLVVGLAAAGIAAWVISGKTDELQGVTGYLSHLRWWWMIVAVAAELGAYLAQSSLQRRLLRAGSVCIPVPQMFGITLAGSAIQNSFPGGAVIYLAYLFRQFRRWGADELTSGWVIIAFNIVSFACLAVIAAVGLALAASAGTAYDLVETILGIVAISALLVLVISERRRLLPHVTRAVRLSQRLVHRPDPRRPAADLVKGWTEELAAISPSHAVWARSATMGMANWLADMSCLALSFMAVGVGVPWKGLLLAYGAGQLAATLPITPGGLGAVEGSITVALVTFGGGAEATVAAVLLYRLVSFWMMLPLGWGAWSILAVAGRLRRTAAKPVTPGSPALESGPPR